MLSQTECTSSVSRGRPETNQKTELNKEWEREQPALPRFSFHLPISKDSLDLKQHFTSLDGRAFGDRKGQEGCTLPGKNYMYTHQAAHGCTLTQSSAEGMELARSTKGANASFITHRCYYARAGTILLRSVELKLYAERPGHTTRL
jgi:hypothetical protein